MLAMRDCHIVLIACWAHIANTAKGAIIRSRFNNDTSTPQFIVVSAPLGSESPENQSLINNVTEQNGTSQFESTISTDTHTLSEWARAELEEPLIGVYSCKGKCGSIFRSYCSCDLRCLVHNNCCEDMETVCPEVLEESRLRYGHMLDMKVECSREKVFLITECGKVWSARTSDHAYNQNIKNAAIAPTASSATAPTASSTTFPTKNKNQSMSKYNTPTQFTETQHDITINDILDAMKDPYVTDTTTGFVYKNMEIFSCAALDNSNPVTWEVALSSDEMTDFNFNFNSIDELLLKTKTVFFSPPTLFSSSIDNALCIFGSIGTCQEKYSMSNTHLVQRCQQFISYVFGLGHVVYNNRYCKVCNDLTKDELETKVINGRTSFGFSLTMTLSGDSLKVTALEHTIFSLLSWQSVTCGLSDSTANQNTRGSCESRCHIYFAKGPDGVCASLTSLLIAVSDDDYPLTVDEYNNFPLFARCFLKLYANVDTENEFSPTFVMFDTTHNTRLFTTQTYVYNFEKNKIEDYLIQNLSLMSKTFKAFRKSKTSTSRGLEYKYNKFSYLQVKSTIEDKLYNSLVGDPPRVIIDRQDRTLTCFSSSNYKPVSSLYYISAGLSCVSAILFEGDDEAISYYLNSTCFSVFDSHSGGVMDRSHAMPFYLALVAFCLL